MNSTASELEEAEAAMPALEDTPVAAEFVLQSFMEAIANAPLSTLLLDFDGTLAPFRVDPSTVRPWAGIVPLLEAIQQTNRTHIAIVSGRPARDVARQLGMLPLPEIWGLHGAERLFRSGELETQPLAPDQHAALSEAASSLQNVLHQLSPGLRLETKSNAVAAHWRGVSSALAAKARTQSLDLLTPFAQTSGMRLLLFDGGIELRAGRHKGDAVHMLLDELPPGAPTAYLGDDITDEDAFEALSAHGPNTDSERGAACLSVLVRRDWRPTAAEIWLRPPAQLRTFLRTWLRSLMLIKMSARFTGPKDQNGSR